ncbi:hypothetical protein KJ608_05075, partial [Patescibacteria group bacterium]|nr:hypothetical protein [Patescibacteria group bacterium]
TMYRMGEYSDERYEQEITTIKNQLKELNALDRVANKSKIDEKKYLKETEAFLRDFKGFWKPLDKKEKRKWIQMLFKRIWIKGQKVVAVEPHNDMKPLVVSLKKLLGQLPSLTPSPELPSMSANTHTFLRKLNLFSGFIFHSNSILL